MKLLKKLKWGLLGLGVFTCVNAQGQVFDTSVRDRIYAAANAGNVAELKRLSSLGYSLEMMDASGNTPYCQAVWSQSRTAVAALIAAGVDVKPACLKRIPYVTETRIYAAAHSEDLDQLVAWKKEGLNVDVVNPRTGNSALCEAVYNYDCPAIQTLLRAGSQQAQPCMRRVPLEVREKLQCRPLKIDWATIGYTILGAGMAGALVAILGSGGGSGTPTCPVTQRWNGDKCISCSTCWIGNTCISQEEMNKKPYYRDETTGDCWSVSPPPVRMSDSELQAAVAKIKDDTRYTNGGYLDMINAAEAHARGYSGYMVERTSPYGRLVNGDVAAGGKPKLSDKKVTVAVFSSGMTIPTVGTASDTIVSVTTGQTTTSNKTVLDFEGVHKGFYDANATSSISYTTGSGTSMSTVNDHNNVGFLGSVTNNFAISGNKVLGFNFDYGPCGSGEGARTTNCYAGYDYAYSYEVEENGKKVTKTEPGTYAVVYVGTTRYYLQVDPVTKNIVSWTTDNPTRETSTKYVDWSAVQSKFFNGLKYDDGYVYDQNKVAPHYTMSALGQNLLVGSQGTLLAGVIAAMKLPESVPAETYGVAYNAAILPVNKDVVRGLTADSMQKMVSSAHVVLLDDVLYADQVGVTDAFGAFTNSDGTYTARKVADVLGGDAYNAYTLLNRDKTGVVAVVPNGNYQKSDLSLKQPTVQSVVPLLSEFNGSTVWTSTSKVLPSVVSTNPLYHLYLTAGSVYSVETTNGVTGAQMSVYSQPCGMAGSYCLMAAGGQSATTNGIYSTTDPTIAGSGTGYSYASTYGTSIAAASVAGSVALLMSAYPHLTSQQVVEILFKTATYIEPSDAQKNNYGETYATGSDSFGSYNSIFGRGVINLAAATEPVGGKQGLWVYRPASGNPVGSNAGVVVTAASTHLLSPASMTSTASLSSALPASFVAFDAYNRPFKLPTASLFNLKDRRKNKSWNDFKLFMRGRDPVLVEPTENFSMMYRNQTTRVSSSSQIPMGLMQVNLKKDKMRYSLFYSQDTTLGKEAYWKRHLTNPFIQMRDAYGMETGYDFNSKWSVEVGWTTGKNGFFDDDDRHFDAPDNKMQAFTSAVVFKPIDKVSFKVATGVMKETGSSLGMVSSGAFNIKGANTHFVGAGMVFTPMDKIRLEAMYYYGQTKTSADGGLMNLSRLTSDSFAVTASYQPTEDHLLGLQVSSPLRVRKGTLNVSLPVGRHPTEDIYYYNTYKADMKPKARELDLSMYYQGNVTDDLSLQSEMGVRLNPDHQADASPDYRGMVGVKWKY